MSDCLFCRIVKKEIPAHVVAEDADTIAFLDIRPVNPGHTMVIPKFHAETLAALSEKQLHAVVDAVQRITPRILAALDAQGYNLGLNAGAVAGQIVPHVHVHIMPRFPDDGRVLWHGAECGNEALAEIAARIRAVTGA